MCRSYLNRARATETLRVGCNHCGSVVIALYDSFRRSALYERHVFSRTYVSMHLRHMNRHSVSCVGSSLRSAMAESGLAGKYWICAATCGKDGKNATYMERIKNTPWGLMFGEKRDVSRFRPFGCRAWMFLNKERHEKGKTAPRAVEVINLGFTSDLNTSAYKVLVEKTGQILSSNQLEFDEGFFPYRKEELIAKLAEMDDEIDILYKASAPIRWIDYDPSLRLGTFKKVDMGSDRHLILQSPSDPNAYLKVEI